MVYKIIIFLINFFLNNISKIINSLGLIFDIVGAWLIAWEIYNKFLDKKYKGGDGGVICCGLEPGTYETEGYKNWEILRNKRMRFGLIILTLGFIFQILSNWLK